MDSNLFFGTFQTVFDGIVSTMQSIKFLGVDLWDFSIGLSLTALAVAVFKFFFLNDNK